MIKNLYGWECPESDSRLSSRGSCCLWRCAVLGTKGCKHPQAKPLKGFKGAGVVEVIEDFDKNTYRCVYTVKYEDKVYVLHAFQKKSKKGIATPKLDLDLISARLKAVKDRAEVSS